MSRKEDIVVYYYNPSTHHLETDKEATIPPLLLGREYEPVDRLYNAIRNSLTDKCRFSLYMEYSTWLNQHILVSFLVKVEADGNTSMSRLYTGNLGMYPSDEGLKDHIKHILLDDIVRELAYIRYINNM